MTRTAGLLRRYVARGFAIEVLLTLYRFAQVPALSSDEPDVLTARFCSADFPLPRLAQGAAFAAKVRQRAGKRRTDAAYRVRAGCSAGAAAAVTDKASVGLTHEEGDEAWKRGGSGFRRSFIDRGCR